MSLSPFNTTPSQVQKTRLPAPHALAVRAALALRRALMRAADAVVPAQLVIFERVAAVAGSVVVAELARLQVADLVAERPMAATELASKTDTDADAMQRTMRAALAMGFFARDDRRRFTNNRLSSALRTGDLHSARSFAQYFGSRSNMKAWCDFPETLRTGESAFERVHGKNVWDWFDEHPHERDTFAQCMMTMTLIEAPGIAAAYPFSEIRKLCDVGGGRGTLLSEVLVQHPHLKAMLSDSPGVLDSARRLLAQRGVLDRVELVPGSFFDAVPRGAEVYVMKNILHDWSDERCVAILKNCRAAMERGSKVLVIEAVVEETTDDYGALADLQMMMVCSGGRERGRADFDRLFGASGFRTGRVLPTPTPMTVFEGVAI